MIHRIEQLVDLNYKYAQYANMYIPKQNLNKTLKFEKKDRNNYNANLTTWQYNDTTSVVSNTKQ